ncbi:hypothetical protein Patl1_14691 [Pistacia atlantica]|uniref:Uncharacterized protein n=1 Tax=Pistacia atlantica TaxID=434234 RepID=A0ACC1AVS0_9ROSI|nr:hypothetical protein Patl1_14691 [Pistacia atlantica]
MAMWGGAIKFLGTKRHHDKWLKDTENYVVKGCFAMTELGHGSNVKGIETVTTYDSNTGEFVINTPCESAQKYCIGGAANVKKFSFFKICMQYRRWSFHSLELMGKIKGFMHSLCRWFDNVRIPKENLLNSIADVSPDGEYLSAIRDPDQRFAAFMAALTSGHVNIASTVMYISKIGSSIAIMYALSRRAFSITPNGPKIASPCKDVSILITCIVTIKFYCNFGIKLFSLLFPYIYSICRYAISSAANYMKMLYVNKTPLSNKTIHVILSAFKATFTWHNQRTLQVRNFNYTSIIYIHVKWSDSDYCSFRNVVKHVDDKA